MTAYSFNLQMERLFETYGKSAYPNERAKILWDQLKDLVTDFEFKLIVTEVIADEPRPPMLSKFREKAAIFREKRYESGRLLKTQGEDYGQDSRISKGQGESWISRSQGIDSEVSSGSETG